MVANRNLALCGNEYATHSFWLMEEFSLARVVLTSFVLGLEEVQCLAFEM